MSCNGLGLRYGRPPTRSISIENMVECRHSSAISVSAYRTWAVVGSVRYDIRSSICMRMISNQIPTLTELISSCRESSTCCSWLIRSHSGVPYSDTVRSGMKKLPSTSGAFQSMSTCGSYDRFALAFRSLFAVVSRSVRTISASRRCVRTAERM